MSCLATWIFDEPGMPFGDKATLLHVCTLAEHTDRCDARVTDLARNLRTSLRTMKKRLTRLEAGGFLAVHDGWIGFHPDLVSEGTDFRRAGAYPAMPEEPD